MRWLIAASVFHIEEPVRSYGCFYHFILPPAWCIQVPHIAQLFGRRGDEWGLENAQSHRRFPSTDTLAILVSPRRKFHRGSQPARKDGPTAAEATKRH